MDLFCCLFVLKRKICLNFLLDLDIDECKEERDDCHKYANCENTIGNFTCACKDGYTGYGRSCTGKL